MIDIAIIGGGLSGSLLAMNLLRYATPRDSIRIFLIDRRRETDMGPAYSAEEGYLLLNVPAFRMGAFSADQEHFLKWAQSKDTNARAWDFLPRKLYKEYIHGLLQQTLRNTKGDVKLEKVRGEVVDITISGGSAEIHLQDDRTLVAHKVVLAWGNFPPSDPRTPNRAFLGSERYVRDPWSPAVFSTLQSRDTVFFVGTGQTMVDLAIGLEMRQHRGRIVAMSRHGYLPLAHKKATDPYPSFYGEIKNLGSIAAILKIVRKHLDLAAKTGAERNSVIDSLRPNTQELWMQLPAEEKSNFVRHLFRYWEIIRSRIPPESEAIINRMRASGQLEIKTGRINDLVLREKTIEVHYTLRGESRRRIETANLVVNCVGPEMDYRKIDHPLIRNLVTRGLIQPDALGLGMQAFPNGAIVNKDGTASDILYTIGLPMKGVLWEVLAVPEIRVQAEQLADILLSERTDRRFSIHGIEDTIVNTPHQGKL